MDAELFLKTHKSDWQALSALLDKAEKNISQLSTAEIADLGRLYRIASSDPALSQRDYSHHRVTQFLNQLVARGHSVLYRHEAVGLNRIIVFVISSFPRIYRQNVIFILAATVIFFLPAIGAGLAIGFQPDNDRWLLPSSAQELHQQLEDKQLWTEIPIEERPYSASFIMRNNIQVSFMAFSGGILAGLPSVYLLAENGLILGGLLGMAFHYGIGFELLTFIVGHGFLELTVIMIAGGAGLRLGWAVIHPGFLKRGDALGLAASQAVWLVLGCIPILIIAGLIEGFISPSDQFPWLVKFSVSLVTGLGLQAYVWLAGRKALPVS
ncbi:MAG: stage II sporulation protein M [Anaerolineaceae bacterium]